MEQRLTQILREWDAFTEPLTAPIVYHPGGWDSAIPAELKREVIRQRIEKLTNGGWDEATDAEVSCYLMTASLVQPLGSDWTNIYLYEAALFMPQLRDVLPDTTKELSDYQKMELRDLKRKIRASQIKNRNRKNKEDKMDKRKLVIDEHAAGVLVGVWQEGCDPITKTLEGNIEEALASIPEFLAEAKEQWAVSKKMPAHTPPASPKPTPATPRATVAPSPKAEDLPLLAGTPPVPPAEVPVTPEAGGLISKDEAVAIAEEQEAAAEETKPAEEGKAPEPPAAAQDQVPEPEVPAAEVPSVEGEPKEAMAD